MKEKWNKDGDIANEDGYSHFPGNTNTLVFRIPDYVATLEKSRGVIPEFVNPKYANAERTVFKAATRLECMMQDYPKLLSSASSKVGFTTYETWYCFSPAKNNVKDALACHTKGLPSFGAAQAEFDFYKWGERMLEIAGVKINREDQTKTNCSGIDFEFGPKILLEPSFALTLKDIRDQVDGECEVFCSAALVLGKTDAGQTQVLANRKIGGLVKSSSTFGSCDKKTATISFEPAAEDDREELLIRGFKPVETTVQDRS